MRWRTALRLGRVSNLPTVWTNTLAGVELAGGVALDLATLPLLIALSLFYVGGMYLNDAFDREIDARERPQRPIPSGEASAFAVFAMGFGMMAVGLLCLLWAGYGFAYGTDHYPALGGLALATAIVVYDWYHKTNPLSPVLMGICRVLVYVTAGLTVTTALPPTLPLTLLLGAAALLCYLIGLTYVAKQETLGEVKNLWPVALLAVPPVYGALEGFNYLTGVLLWVALVGWVGYALSFLIRRRPGDVPRAVVSLIAGISLLDGLLIAGTGAAAVAWLAVLGFLLTLAFQRYVPGT